MNSLEKIVEKVPLDAFGLYGSITQFIINLYKSNKDKKEAEINLLMNSVVSLALDKKNYYSFKVYGPTDFKEIFQKVNNILEELKVDNISMIADDILINHFVNKFRASKVIEVETVNGDGCAADIDQFYKTFEECLKYILNEKIYNNETIYKTLLMEIQKLSYKDDIQMMESLDEIKKILKEMMSKLQEVCEEKNSNKRNDIIVISMGEYNKDEYSESLDLRDYFDGRTIKKVDDWRKIEKYINEFANNLKKKMNKDMINFLHLSAHLSIAYCTGICLNGKGMYNINLKQITSGNILDWSIDTSLDKREFSDNMFLVNEHIVDENNNDVAIAISTMNKSIYNDINEYIKANRIPIKRIIEFDMGDNGGGRSVKNGTHAKTLADQVRKEIDKRDIKERKGNLHIFMAVPVSLAFFLGQVSFAFNRIRLYEHTIKDIEKEIYTPSIFIDRADELS